MNPAQQALARSMTERELQAAVESCLRLNGWLFFHAWNSQHSAAGFPDICATSGGRLLFVELKSEAGKLTKAQELWQSKLQVVPGDVETYIWRPSDWLSGTIQEVLR